ncbi:1-phosphofructokinase [Salinivibrio sp. ES.052]|uniref:1-phosphofructokinase n=1 Tax=Salinivibrio sp. ES.052 TaxID=1882823 RepID=UPI00092871A4|nr:1-phosphofructokinase [Salinivibrio sp. ES.052]SIN85071.1 1-phosphofructokinase [Salinivibrio sp. ES.052]
MSAILTVTFNPALDMTGALGVLQAGDVNLVQNYNLHPAGKGVNVARVLSDLGADVSVSGFLGADNQDPFAHLFTEQGVHDHFLRVPGVSRTNVKLVEKDGRVTDLNFPGMAVEQTHIDAFTEALLSLADDHEWIVLAGSLPPGLSTVQLNTWISSLSQKGKKVIVDTSQHALRAAVDAVPWLIKPNEAELAQCLNAPITNEQAELLARGEQLFAQGIANIVISRGVDGVLWRDHQGWLKAVAPAQTVVSTVGAGDSLVAGLVWGCQAGLKKEAALCRAVALSALAVTQVGVGVGDIEDVNQLTEQISVSPVELSVRAQ